MTPPRMDPNKQTARMFYFLLLFSSAEKFTSTHETLMISRSKQASITERVAITLYEFHRRAKLETQVWLAGLLGRIQIYETADLNPRRPALLSTLGLQL